MDRVALTRAEEACALLREPNGFDEADVEGTDLPSALRLIDRLLVARPGALAPGAASSLRAADRDLLLARVYARAFGWRVEATASCAACGEPYDVDFSLEELAASALAEVPAGGPTGEDVRAALAAPDPAAELRRRCAPQGDEAIAEAGRGLDVDLAAACPECGAAGTVRFDVQSYLLGALLRERPRLLRELHALARAYRWSHDEIMGLPRSRRRALAGLVEAAA
jgi:hypothetical protein